MGKMSKASPRLSPQKRTCSLASFPVLPTPAPQYRWEGLGMRLHAACNVPWSCLYDTLYYRREMETQSDCTAMLLQGMTTKLAQSCYQTLALWLKLGLVPSPQIIKAKDCFCKRSLALVICGLGTRVGEALHALPDYVLQCSIHGPETSGIRYTSCQLLPLQIYRTGGGGGGAYKTEIITASF